MKAIKITQKIKDQNNDSQYHFVMINSKIGDIKELTIPTKFHVTEKVSGGYEHRTDLHEVDGIFDLIIPEILENQKLGEIYFNEENQVFTYQVLQLTVEELKSRIPQTVSQRQLRTQLVLIGFNLTDIDTAINSLSEPDKSIAQIAWDYAITFERESPLLVSLALMLGLTETDLENIFINASKL